MFIVCFKEGQREVICPYCGRKIPARLNEAHKCDGCAQIFHIRKSNDPSHPCYEHLKKKQKSGGSKRTGKLPDIYCCRCNLVQDFRGQEQCIHCRARLFSAKVKVSAGKEE